MANKFNLHFSTIADKLRSVLPNVAPDLSKLRNFVNSKKSPDVLFTIPAMTDAQVLNALKIINQHKAAGIDKISARLLKTAAPQPSPSRSEASARKNVDVVRYWDLGVTSPLKVLQNA
jgi:hypothetical protein